MYTTLHRDRIKGTPAPYRTMHIKKEITTTIYILQYIYTTIFLQFKLVLFVVYQAINNIYKFLII